MSSLRSFRRKLNPLKVQLAEQVAYERIKVARQVVKDRCEKDAEFARDVLKAVGEALPQEIKETCEKTIAGENAPKVEKDFTPPPSGIIDGEPTKEVQELVDKYVQKA